MIFLGLMLHLGFLLIGVIVISVAIESCIELYNTRKLRRLLGNPIISYESYYYRTYRYYNSSTKREIFICDRSFKVNNISVFEIYKDLNKATEHLSDEEFWKTIGSIYG